MGPNESRKSDRAASGILDGRYAERNIYTLAALADVHAIGDRNHLFALEPFQKFGYGVRFIRRDQEVPGASQDLAGRIAVNGLGTPIPTDDRAAQGENRDGLIGAFNNRSQLRKPFFETLAFGDDALEHLVLAHQVAGARGHG